MWFLVSANLEIIRSLVVRYLNAGELPWEEFSEEWLYDGDVKSSSISEMETGEGLIRKLL